MPWIILFFVCAVEYKCVYHMEHFIFKHCSHMTGKKADEVEKKLPVMALLHNAPLFLCKVVHLFSKDRRKILLSSLYAIYCNFISYSLHREFCVIVCV